MSFQAVHDWAEGSRPSQAGQSLGNEFPERRAEVAMEASQSSVIGKDAIVALFCVSLNMLMNLGTQGYSANQRCMVVNKATTSASLIPPF